MRPTTDFGIVFESPLEVRVATEVLNANGYSELVEAIEPPVTEPRLGRLEYLKMAKAEQQGQMSSAESTIADHEVAILTLRALTSSCLNYDRLPEGQLPLTRERYARQMVTVYTDKVLELGDKRIEEFEARKKSRETSNTPYEAEDPIAKELFSEDLGSRVRPRSSN